MPAIGDVFWAGPRVPARARTLTYRCVGSLPSDGSARVGIAPDPETGDPGTEAYTRTRKCRAVCVAPGAGPLSRAIMKATPGAARHLGFLIEVQDGFGGSASYDGRADAIQPPNGDASNDSEFVAEWTLTGVQTWFQLYFLNVGVAGADGDPNYAGPATGDVNPRALGIRLYEVAPAGSVATATMTTTGAVVCARSCTTTLAAPYVVADYHGSVELALRVVNNLGTISTAASAEMAAHWESMGPATEVADAEGPMDCAVLGGHVEVSVVGAFVSGGPTAFGGGVALGGEPDRIYRAMGRLYAMDRDYPAALTLGIHGSPAGEPQSVTLAPTGETEFRQRAYLAESIWDDGSRHALGSAAEWETVRTSLTSASLAAAGEDADDWVTMIADRSYPAVSVWHDPETALPDPGRAGSVWSHDFGAGTPGDWEGYAWLRLRLAGAEAGTPVTLSLDSDDARTYTLRATGVASADYLVDLCRPDSPGPDADPELWDSRYPLRNDGLPHRDPPGWGVGRVRSYSISGGADLTVEEVALTRRTPAIQDASPAFRDWDLVQTPESYAADGTAGAAPIVQGSRGVVMTVDGRRSIVEPCSLRQLSVDGLGNPIWVYSGRNARHLEATLNACPGWGCDDSPYTPGDGWMALDGSEGANLIDGGPIYYAGWSGFHGGGGALWTGGVCASTLGREMGAAATVSYQPRYHEVCLYPAAGDVWGDSGGAYDVATPLRVAKILRASVDGIAYGAAGSVVRLRDAGTVASSAPADARLRYRMGPVPLGKGQRDHSVDWTGRVGEFLGDWDDGQALGTAEATQGRWNARRWHRAVFRRRSSQAGAVALAARSDGAIHLATVDADSSLVDLASASPPAPTTFVPVFETTASATRVALATGDGRGRSLWVATISPAGPAELRRTADGGATWNLMITLPPSTDVALTRASESRILVYTVEAGTVRRRVYGPDGEAVGAADDTDVTGLSGDARIAAVAYPRTDASFGIDLAVIDGAAAYVVSSVDGGKTFE